MTSIPISVIWECRLPRLVTPALEPLPQGSHWEIARSLLHCWVSGVKGVLLYETHTSTVKSTVCNCASWGCVKKARQSQSLTCSFLCFPPVGPVSVHLSSPLSLEEIRQRNPLVLPGGRYRPPDCEPRHHTAIVVPYRNRQTHLRALLYHLHPFLQRQQIHYSIYIVHQVRLHMSVILEPCWFVTWVTLILRAMLFFCWHHMTWITASAKCITHVMQHVISLMS